jgi:O-antigen ligase
MIVRNLSLIVQPTAPEKQDQTTHVSRRVASKTKYSTSRQPRRHDRHNATALVFLGLLLVGGGAGLGYPLIEAACQCVAVLLIGDTMMARRDWSATQRSFVLMFAAAAILLLAQILPLPAVLWHSLPDRQTAVRIMDLLGQRSAWHALSLTPDRTVSSLLALLVPCAAMLTVARLRPAGRIVALRSIVAGSVMAAAFAALQVAAGSASAPILYETAHRGYGVGFFVNRNHQATLLLVAIILAAVPGVAGTRPARHVIMLATVSFLALGVLATSSRTALVLLPLSLLTVAALSTGVRRRGRVILIAAVAYLVGGLLLTRTELFERVTGRFATLSEELRYQYWDNSLYAIRQSLPVGTGFGSFERVYRGIEPLGQVSPLSVNHVHNDYLELVLEGGVPAILLALVACVVLGRALASAWRSVEGRQERATLVAAASSLSIILLFSLVDYPLRMAAIAGLFGALLGLIAAVAHRSGRADEPSVPAGKRRATIVTVLAAAVALVALADASARALVRRDAGALASRFAPWSSNAWTARAEAEQRAGKQAQARASAAHALRIVPVDPTAIRVHGFADLLLGQATRGTALLETAAALGWRDTLLQLWLIDRARQAGAAGIAAERIDALLRRAQLPEPMMQQLRIVYASKGGVNAVVARLEDRPPWRRGFFNAISQDAARNLSRTDDLLARLRARGIAATPDETLLIRGELGQRGQVAAARAIWRASGGRGEIADGGFEQTVAPLPTGVFPYAWSQIGSDGVKLILADRGADNSAHAVQIVTDGLTSSVPLVQLIALSAGNWRVSAQVRGSDAPAALTLTCVNLAQTVAVRIGLAAPGNDWRRVATVARVGADCPAQLLGIAVEERDGQTSPFWIDDVRVTRVR